jgi:hypothetical protein
VKINPIIYKKLVAQAEEAKNQQMVKLANGILSAVGPDPDEERLPYSYSQLKDDLYNDMWKVATRLINYHDLKSIDAEKLHSELESCAGAILDELESALGLSNVIKTAMEPELFGEDDIYTLYEK